METLRRIVQDAKSLGKRICLTSGAFDLFHYSHLDLIRKSSEICDFLIVGVDSDNSVSDYKSYKRPIIPEEKRLEIINSLDCIDAVFIKNTPLDINSHIQLYKDLMIDIVTIGFNYGFEEKVGIQTAKAGVRLIRLRTDQLDTTTTIIDSIVERYSIKKNTKRHTKPAFSEFQDAKKDIY